MVPFVFGMAVAVMIYTVGHISGAHFNPPITFAFAVARHFPKRDVVFYWLAQFAGALAAMGLLVMLLPGGDTLGTTLPLIGLEM